MGALSVPDLDRKQRYTVIRNNVLNYYSLNRLYFSQRGGRLGSSGSRTGYNYNPKNLLFEDSRGDSYAMPRSYIDGRYYRKSQEINMVNKKITNLADPQSDKDAINKQYLEKSHNKPIHYNK